MSNGWRPRGKEQPRSTPTTFPGNESLGKLSERLTLQSKIFLKLALPAFILFFLCYFFYLVYSPAYRLTVFRAAKSLEADGYSGDVFRDAFAFHINRIEEGSRTVERRLSHIEATESKIDFQIPRTSFSFQGLVQTVRDAIGPGDVVVTADVVKNGATYEMFALVNDPKPLRNDRDLRSSGDSLDAVIADTALKVVAALDPIVAGNYKAERCREKRQGTPCTEPEIADAAADLRLALSQARDDRERYRALLGLGNLFAIAGEHPIARFYAVQATKLSVAPAAYEMVGIEDMALGAHSDAMSMFRHVLERDNKAWYAHEDLGNDWIAQGDKPENWRAAIPEYEAAIDASPENIDAKAKLGFALYKLGWTKDAVECFTEVVALEPDNAEYHNDLANAIRELSSHPQVKQQQHGRWCAPLTSYPGLDYAIAQYAVAIQLAHDQKNALWESYAHLDLGKTLEANDNDVSAEHELKQAITINPGDSFAVAELAELCGRAAAAALKHSESQVCGVLADAVQVSRSTSGVCGKAKTNSEEIRAALNQCGK